MKKLHIANISFEAELAHPIHSIYPSNPIFLQLQYLPFLYANPGDGIVVSHRQPGFPQLTQHLLTDSNPNYDKIESWGGSELIAKWAKKQKLPYPIPSWDTIRSVNSKAFSFQHSPKLPGATLLENETQALQWLQRPSPKVLKTCYGVSGQGHLIIDSKNTPSDEKIFLFLQKEWSAKRPVIAEPWVERLLDFSTQWEIPTFGSIQFIGSTICENNTHGQYLSNRVGKEETLFQSHLPYLQEHKHIALHMLEKMQSLGFFGNVGIDAMLYIHPSTGNSALHPIVEINARKTMGWVSVIFQQKHFPNHEIHFTYLPAEEGLLPSSIALASGKKIQFHRNLKITVK